ncbi:MAG: hypothetical protein IJ617_02895 [Oscillospiraceae bacterium]|nr:hypothetical protein [Oscillospiraceae bacterium]
MKASFDYAVRYEIAAACRTPMRTADAQGNTEAVLRSPDGSYFIQGSSICGAFREWVRQNEPKGTDESLFGGQKKAGSLIFSDAVFSDSAELTLRPRLRIDGKTGSAFDGGKFDIAHIATGAELLFTVTWLGCQSRLSETEAAERMLAALDRGDILLGAQKTNGFGRVSLSVKKREFDLSTPAGRESWLEDQPSGAELNLAELHSPKQVAFRLRGMAGHLLVKDAAAEQTDGGSYTPNLSEAGYPVIPGSSVKGVVRARAELIAGYMGLPKDLTEGLFGRMSSNEDNGRPGRVRFEDVVFQAPRRQKISRIRINRLTGGVIRGGLFCEEPVSGEVAVNIAAPAEDRAGCMLLLYALRDLALGLYGIGSGSAVGRGILDISELQARLPDGRGLTLRFDEARRCEVSDPDGIIPEWYGAWEAVK